MPVVVSSQPPMMPEFRMHQMHQVSPIIYYNVRPVLEYTSYMGVVFLIRSPVPGIDIQPVIYKGRRHIILGGKRVAAGHVHLSPSCSKDLAQVGGLCLKMHRQGDLQPGERLLFAEPLLQTSQKRHIVFHPFYFQLTIRPESSVPYLTFHNAAI